MARRGLLAFFLGEALRALGVANVDSPSAQTTDDFGLAGFIPCRVTSAAISRLAQKVLDELAGKNRSGQEASNIVVSPISLAMLLELLWYGSAGNTRDSLSAALGYLDCSSTYTSGLRRNVISRSSLWISPDLHLDAAYRLAVEECCAAEVRLLPNNAAAAVNAWAAQATQQKISHLLDHVNPATRVLLVNAVYFRAVWLDPFERGATNIEIFNTGSGQQVRVPFMHRDGKFKRLKFSDHDWVRLPYRDLPMALDLLLPAIGIDPLRILPKLFLPHSESVLSQGHVALPRFILKFNANLNAALASVGLDQLFQVGRADFSRMGPNAIAIDELRQSTYLEINESGTEAAAATSAAMFGSLPESPPNFTISFNRPFIAAVVDMRDDAPMFVAIVRNPSKI